MRKFFSITSLLCIVLCFMASSCGKHENNQELTNAKISGMIARSDSMLPNYRYVDLDSVLSNYNLAKDYNEEMLRMQSSMQSEVKRHENSLQSLATTMQNKLQNNGYLSEASLKADQQQYADLQNKAQRAVASLQSNFETTAMLAQKTVNDSIEAFIQDYNMKKGYDAIFFKAATLYINPALDITNEVIEGLNARYNKVK
ncbi:MAG: OmpH family outer membrane protein [Muribaculaceae bacterium]|nr:OmpH family outer membrane protein [Muribaculaceae bacterium]